VTEKWPTSAELTKLTLTTLSECGGSCGTSELDHFVLQKLNLTPDLISIMRSGNRTEIQYRLAWIRTKAKQKGFVVREANKMWKITEEGMSFLKI
jgi:restriction system protein